jgi:phytoene/squalene synthetase
LSSGAASRRARDLLVRPHRRRHRRRRQRLRRAAPGPAARLPRRPAARRRRRRARRALARAIADYRLPLPLLLALLDAFEEDTRHAGYADRDALLRYCSRSANPVGRLLLHLHGLDDPALAARSDAVCTALQLINFWQDLSVDLPRGT